MQKLLQLITKSSRLFKTFMVQFATDFVPCYRLAITLAYLWFLRIIYLLWVSWLKLWGYWSEFSVLHPKPPNCALMIISFILLRLERFVINHVAHVYISRRVNVNKDRLLGTLLSVTLTIGLASSTWRVSSAKIREEALFHWQSSRFWKHACTCLIARARRLLSMRTQVEICVVI